MDDHVTCGGCGCLLAEPFGLPISDRVPCGNCGSVGRDFAKAIGSTLTISGHISGTQRRGNRAIGFFESPRQGLAADAAQEPDGRYRFSLTGPPPQGEADTLDTCRVLLEKLNTDGGQWKPPTQGAGVVDCVARSHVAGRPDLEIQVVRAIAAQSFWRGLKQRLQVRAKDATVRELAEHLHYAIARKATDSRIPPSVRQNLLLALDATRIPVLALDSVAEYFRDVYGTWARSLRFASVWVVGPTSSLCHKLD